MEDIEPRVFRQRAVIEAKINVDVNEDTVKDFLQGLADYLELKIYGGPIVYSTGTEGKEVNQGFDGFCALVDSGIHISVWKSVNFVGILIHTCKSFKIEDAVRFTQDFFKATEIVYKEF